MLNTSIERFIEAAKDGEMLTVVYSGGHHPGSMRRILPIRVAGHLLYARDPSSLLVKTYRLDGLSIVQDEFNAPWIDETLEGRQAAFIVDDPNVYFGSWNYAVHKALWPALGVTLREYVDKEKAKSLRAEAKRHGHRYVAPKYLAYAVSKPPLLDFQEGDLFFSARNPLLALQVVARRKLLEVHQVTIRNEAGEEVSSSLRRAFQLIDDELAEWLQTGVVPAHAQIDAAKSYSEVLRFSIASPPTSIESAS
jgi:hypothetical protein